MPSASHARRKFWEAAIATKEPAAREALLRIRALFKLEEDWADLAPKQRHDRRQLASGRMLDAFFAWADGVFEGVRSVRGPVASAFGYAEATWIFVWDHTGELASHLMVATRA